MNTDIRLSHSCASCRFFKGSRNRNNGLCILLETPRSTSKIAVCDGFEPGSTLIARLKYQVCVHDRVPMLRSKRKTFTPSGVAMIELRMEERCLKCGRKSRNLETLKFYALEPNKRATKNLILTTQRSAVFQAVKRMYDRLTPHEPLPQFKVPENKETSA